MHRAKEALQKATSPKGEQTDDTTKRALQLDPKHTENAS